jgi:hypothetical protein
MHVFSLHQLNFAIKTFTSLAASHGTGFDSLNSQNMASAIYGN